MIIKGRSPTMRHVSRTHRVALDWLFDRVNLEPKIHIKYVDTKNQLADMLTKERFTRDEWNHLLCLFNIMSFSMFSCSHFSNFLSDLIGKQSVYVMTQTTIPRPRGSGKLFLPIHRMEELCQQRSPKWLQDWCVITIKTQRFVGTR